ncbi:MAG: polyamine aminopropyltransferase [Nitrospirota bacterium]|nr:polyamine aminopropyltransferase [Nitrospirota bacterium]
MNGARTSKWYIEYAAPSLGHMHGIDEIIVSHQTNFQKVDILKTNVYGKALALDEKMQSTQVDEFIYHEALVHPAMIAHPSPRSVLIIGGGEGATLREALKHPTVEKAVMVDIDDQVISLSKKHLPEWHQGSFEDPRSTVLATDARKYLEESKDIFDVIITDLSEPVEEGPAYLLYTREFYQIACDHLSPGGTISVQAGPAALPFLLAFSAVFQTMRSAFPTVRGFSTNIPSFGLPWGFTLASKGVDPLAMTRDAVDRILTERNLTDLRFYDGLAHQGLFGIPRHIREELDRSSIIIEDNHPIFAYH